LCVVACYPLLSWFMARFESTGAHGCGEQWNTRDTRVYTGLGLREDKKPYILCVSVVL
jgi:hypothetical protein